MEGDKKHPPSVLFVMNRYAELRGLKASFGVKFCRAGDYPCPSAKQHGNGSTAVKKAMKMVANQHVINMIG
jgi:hypothetical protein